MRSLLATIVVMSMLGCGSPVPPEAGTAQTVLVDVKTREPIVLPIPDTYPAVNPTTGTRTLMPGLYCPQCQQWYPVPAPDQINHGRRGALCPKTRTPLVFDGPWPNAEQ